ncbi:Uncharacterised protein [Yersinia intermedia]|nr:Uncharacterised protein [Yersinia intermedia]
MRELHKILAEEEADRLRARRMLKNVPAEARNKSCPCGSGRKGKNCQCDMFKGNADAE